MHRVRNSLAMCFALVLLGIAVPACDAGDDEAGDVGTITLSGNTASITGRAFAAYDEEEDLFFVLIYRGNLEDFEDDFLEDQATYAVVGFGDVASRPGRGTYEASNGLGDDGVSVVYIRQTPAPSGLSAALATDGEVEVTASSSGRFAGSFNVEGDYFDGEELREVVMEGRFDADIVDAEALEILGLAREVMTATE